MALRQRLAAWVSIAAMSVPQWTPVGANAPATHIKGTVSIREANQPLDAIVVKAYSSELNLIKVVQTDEFGRFDLGSLPPGRYDVWASRLPFVQIDPITGISGPRILSISEGLTAELALSLERGGVIGGTVVNADLAAAQMTSVALYRVLNSAADRPKLGRQIGEARTDLKGAYRFAGIAPGAYTVLAPTRVPTRLSDRESYATEFYPGRSHLGPDSVIVLEKGEARLNLNFTVRSQPTRSIAGVVLAPTGQPAGASEVFIIAAPEDPGVAVRLRIPVGSNGKFEMSGVRAGAYWIVARVRTERESSSAALPLRIEGSDMKALQIQLRPDKLVSGTITSQGAAGASRASLAGVTISLRRTTSTGKSSPIDQWSAVSDSNGRFVIKDVVSGKYWLSVSESSPGAAITSAVLGGIVADGVVSSSPYVDLDAIRNSSALEIRLTRNPTEIIGGIADPQGRAVSTYGIVAFPEDRELRLSGSPLIRYASISAEGNFSIIGLPPGRYLLATVGATNPEEILDPDVLERIQPLAVGVTLSESQHLRVQLQIAR